MYVIRIAILLLVAVACLTSANGQILDKQKLLDTGQYAGNDHGRELIGYVPWQFNLPDDKASFASAWKFLTDRNYFAADFGPTDTERLDPQFLVADEHYFHSGFNDLVITGLIGLRPQSDNQVHINPLVPSDWMYFALVDVPYRQHLLSILWDRDGSRYGLGAGLHLLVDGERVASRQDLGTLDYTLPAAASSDSSDTSAAVPLYNFAVNNDGQFYPHLEATYTAQGTSVAGKRHFDDVSVKRCS